MGVECTLESLRLVQMLLPDDHGTAAVEGPAGQGMFSRAHCEWKHCKGLVPPPIAANEAKAGVNSG